MNEMNQTTDYTLRIILKTLSYEVVLPAPWCPEISVCDGTPSSWDYRMLYEHQADVLITDAASIPYPVLSGLKVYALTKRPDETGAVVIVGRCDDIRLTDCFSAQDVRVGFGWVTLVGFGPGSPDLLTLAGDKALSEADVIIHDDLLDQEYLAKYRGEKIHVGKRMGRSSFQQSEINRMVFENALEGRSVVRLKGGDPMVFAHGREEIDYLESRFIEVRVIPGISSGNAMAAYTHIPLTHRGMATSYAFALGHGKKIRTYSTDTLVYYMGGTNLQRIAESLLADGRAADTAVALVYNVSRANQRTYFCTLRELRYAVLNAETPILVVIGKVVELEKQATFQRILSTGTVSPKGSVEEIIEHTPLIKISKAKLEAEDLRLLTEKPYDWIVFTSRYGVRYFFELLADAGLAFDKLFAKAEIATVGPVTSQELAGYGYKPTIESASESAEGLISLFHHEGVNDRRILLPRSDKGLKSLYYELLEMNNEVTDLTVYLNTPNPDAQMVDVTMFDKILFSSPSGVEAFLGRYGVFPEGPLLIAKGRTTCNKLMAELDKLKKLKS